MDFRVLGPLEVESRGRTLQIRGAKERALLAMLLFRANRLVSRDWLIDELWGKDPPASAKHTLEAHVSRLRGALAGAGNGKLIESQPGGYRIRVEGDHLDLLCFEQLLEEGRSALASGAPEEAEEKLAAALALWRGPVLTDLADKPFAEAETRRLEELRLAGVEARLEAALALGRNAELVGELQALVARHPLRERLRAQLMLALYRSGRQAEALAVYREGRSRLVEELGIEPSRELQELEQAILRQEPQLLQQEIARQAAELEAPASPRGQIWTAVAPAARIGVSAHGGQVGLVVQTTRGPVEDELPDAGSLRALEGPTNLPVPPTRLIGRERELATAARLLRADVRLLTLTGPAGSGKTRLALRAAAELVDDFPDGVFLVALAPVGDPELVLPTIAQTLGARESSSLTEVLASKRLLLVLDNLEHLVDAAPVLGELLAAAAQLKLLVTSRVPLHLSGEHQLQVPPLKVPDPAHLPEIDALSAYEAVALFLERARAVKADFAVTPANATAIAELCVRLDGLPLAIELAAARTKLLPPQALLARLGQCFELLSGGPRDAPARQRTLRATIDWSYDLLGPEERALFARLAVFVGGCTLEAAEAVCGAEVLLTELATLIDGNLLREEEQPEGEPRFTMLETIRAYALERLDASGEAEEIRGRHAAYLLALVDHRWDRGTFGPVPPGYERELSNFCSALAWLQAQGDAERAVRLAVRVPWWWFGWFAEAVRWRDEVLRLLPAVSPGLQAEALCWASLICWNTEDLPAARAYGERALARSREVGDRLSEGRSLIALSYLAGESDAVARDAGFAEAATIFRELGDEAWLLWVLHLDALLAIGDGDYARARAGLEEGLASARELGFTDLVANALADLGILALYERRLEDAVRLFADSLELAPQLGWHALVTYCLNGLGCALASLGKLDTAARLLGASETQLERLGQPIDAYAVRAFDECGAPVRERLDEPGLAAAWAAGRTMSEADATKYALNAVAEQVP